MPDDKIKYSEAYQTARATQLHTTDILGIAQVDPDTETGYGSKGTDFDDMSKFFLKGIQFSSDLQTTNKTVIGAINEVKSSAKENLSDLSDTTITTPSNADLLAYDSSTSKWVNTDLKGQASGSIATFSNGGNGIPVSEFECEIGATGGGGTPDSPIAINGFSQADITVTDNDQTGNLYTVAFGQTIYGGRLIYANGQWSIEATWGIVDLGSLTWTYDSVYDRFLSNPFNIDGIPSVRTMKILCTCYQTISDGRPLAQVPNNSIYNGGGTKNLCVHDNRFTVGTDLKTALSGQHCTYELETKTIIPITSSTRVKTISGDNNIYSNTGDCELKYFTNKANSLAELIKAFVL